MGKERGYTPGHEKQGSVGKVFLLGSTGIAINERVSYETVAQEVLKVLGLQPGDQIIVKRDGRDHILENPLDLTVVETVLTE